MIAALPMYLRAENRAAHDLFWGLVRDGLRARGIEAPDSLDHELGPMEGWARPDLVLGQICNLPWRLRLRGKVTLIGAADHGLGDCTPGHYYSVLVARTADARRDPAELARRFAYNDATSNSGWGAPWFWAQARGHALMPRLETGSHAESARAVLDGAADLAAIDAITWRNLLRWWPGAAGLSVIGRTGSTPGMTFISRPGVDPRPYFDAISDAIVALPGPEAVLLGLRAVVVLPPTDYDLPLPPDPGDLRATA
ncbi:MAG: PhnD/SsuA/transferrin family substrate-binding protein [Rubellimicrobium sp.]|nr:PhnD/SsuA/transferrin family substrate-binding protein [Rubellimicrobium sp.]